MTKPSWETRNDREVIGEWAVYPGHPVTVAFVIVAVFESFEEAFAPSKSGPPNALTAMAVPGAGGCVYNALSLLQRLKEGMPPESAFAWADEVWDATDDMKRKDSPKWKLGQEQADRFKPKLLARKAWWEAASQSSPALPPSRRG